MTSSVSPTDCYWQYLESMGLHPDTSALSLVARSMGDTCWDEPTSALELNNFAVLALIEAEQCEESSLRGLSLEMALDALQGGVELGEYPLCVAHLALVQTMTGEMQLGMQTAFSALINSLQPANANEQKITPGIVYLPPGKGGKDSRSERLAQILAAADGYTQALQLLSEVLCRSQLVFYNQTGLRFLHLAAQILPPSADIDLRLGISSVINHQWEGLVYLHRARKLAPDSATIVQALYLAYRDLGQLPTANTWMEIGGNLNGLDAKWTELDSESSITYLPFEEQLSLAVEPSLRSLVTSVLLAEGDWFEQEMEFWRSWIKPGMTVIDVGANVGVYTFSAAVRVGSEGCVLAVEPFSGCVGCLQETCRINQLDWVKVCAGAASDRNGKAKLALQGASELNEIIAGEAQVTNPGIPVEEVECFTLDSLVEQEDISQVDLLKIDAEGHELQVLAGSNRILTEFAPTILYENIAGSRGSNLAAADFLKARGYQLFRYQPYLQRLIPINSREDLQGRLNLIAMVDKSHSTIS
ncbi:MAG: FkbM family methyltransferase [Symploca sp. SIO2E6]|nr:FkbM family methyltransferase [Symploca sp. SIO2E6]